MRIFRPILLAGLAGLLLTGGLPSTGATASARASSEESLPPHDPERVLVAFRPGTPGSARASAHAAEQGQVENTLEWLNLDVVRLPRGRQPAAAAARYERNPNVEYTDLNWEYRLDSTSTSTPNDLLFNDEWGLHNTEQTVTGSLAEATKDADIDAPEGWYLAFGADSFPSSGGARVGVLDTGIDLAHVDLLGKTKACANALAATGTVVEGACSDDNLHGTHVAGTIAAHTNNSIGVAGVAPNAELAVFKALNSAGVGFYADVIAGIHWLRTTGGARIINMSIGGPQDDGLDEELSEAAKAGTLLVAAAGNDGDKTANYPAFHPDVVSVAATDRKDERASFSNYNSDVEVAAPGVDVWSTTPGNSYAPLDGTSMATPHVSGVAAMISSQNPTWSASDVRRQLTGTVDDLGPAGRDVYFGYGRVNLAKAFGGAAAPPPTADPGTIAGAVIDATSTKGIGGAAVDCGSGGMATTAFDGKYAINDVPVGSYTCKASATGYQSKSQSVTVNSNQTTTANFALRKRR